MAVELEVFDYDIEKASLIGPAPYAAKFAADMRGYCANFGLLIDLSHIPMTYETPEFVVQTLRPYITHLHMGNTVCSDPAADGYGDQHQRFGFPLSANDTPELLEYLRVLKREGFMRPNDPMVLSFEVKPWKDEDPDVVITNAKRVLNRAWVLLADEE
jgi:sugar phosphate isomerase/epimerase